MKKRITLGAGVFLLLILVALVVWQGSFKFGSLAPSSVEQTYVFWALSTLIFILTVMLGFILLRSGVKLYIERKSNRPGSHIKSKLMAGALALTFLPVFFLVLWSVSVLNYNLDKWFSRPAQTIRLDLINIGRAIDAQARQRLIADAHWLASLPPGDAGSYQQFCQANGIEQLELKLGSDRHEVLCAQSRPGRLTYGVEVPTSRGVYVLATRGPIDLDAQKRDIERSISDYDRLAKNKNEFRSLYLLLLSLITLFILFFATWVARYLAGHISTPINSLLQAAEQVSKGNLEYRVRVDAIDELATLVKAFNEMTEALETNSKELEARRKFTETILESMPSAVLSVTGAGTIQSVNRAFRSIFSEEQIAKANQIDDLFCREDAAQIRYVMNRARRTGVAGTDLELKLERRVLHLAITVAALDDQRRAAGFVILIEDTSELLRAQKAAAWHEVARRVAHEIKNPLTPIALCSDRIARHLDRSPASPESQRILHECSATIAREVESVRTLIDEFSQLARFPAAHPVPCDLNEVVENALAVFSGRLDGIQIRKDLATALPVVNIDREQFKRVIVNLVDNAAEAMQNSLLRELYIATRESENESIELILSDTGSGISREDKEKLFLPYFSTKGRGTGLGLAIVSRILTEHDALVRVEDNSPQGARFIIDIPKIAAGEPAPAPADVRRTLVRT